MGAQTTQRASTGVGIVGGLAMTAASVNAIPVAGQFAALGLGIAAGLTQLFMSFNGPVKRKRARRRAGARAAVTSRQQSMQNRQATGAGGQLNTGPNSVSNTPPRGAGAPATPPVFGGGVSPQQTLTGINNG